MSSKSMNSKNRLRKVLRIIYISIAALGLGIFMFLSFTAWKEVPPGHEGFLDLRYDGGIDTEHTFREGSYYVAPWNKMITYSIQSQVSTIKYEYQHAEIGTVTIDVKFHYGIQLNHTADLHLKLGRSYRGHVNKICRKALGQVVALEIDDLIKGENLEGIENDLAKLLSLVLKQDFIELKYLEIIKIKID